MMCWARGFKYCNLVVRLGRPGEDIGATSKIGEHLRPFLLLPVHGLPSRDAQEYNGYIYSNSMKASVHSGVATIQQLVTIILDSLLLFVRGLLTQDISDKR